MINVQVINMDTSSLLSLLMWFLSFTCDLTLQTVIS